MSKHKRRKLRAERAVALAPTMTFDVLTICWSGRTVTYKGQTYTIDPESDCFAIPLLNDLVPHFRTGWYPAMGARP